MDVCNAFNSVSWSTIFRELWSLFSSLDQFFSFVWWFYTRPSPLYIFLGFLTWGFHNHFVEIMYMTRAPIGRSIVCSGSFSHFSHYSSNPPYLCFPFLSKWYTYSKSQIKCGSYVFTIIIRVININTLSAISEVCSLVSLGVRPLCITSSWPFYFNSSFHILDALVGSISFVRLFMAKALHKDLGMIFNLPMFTNL